MARIRKIKCTSRDIWAKRYKKLDQKNRPSMERLRQYHSTPLHWFWFERDRSSFQDGFDISSCGHWCTPWVSRGLLDWPFRGHDLVVVNHPHQIGNGQDDPEGLPAKIHTEYAQGQWTFVWHDVSEARSVFQDSKNISKENVTTDYLEKKVFSWAFLLCFFSWQTQVHSKSKCTLIHAWVMLYADSKFKCFLKLKFKYNKFWIALVAMLGIL